VLAVERRIQIRAYGADFRAYIKPELITNPNDPLNVLAQSAGLGKFPAGIDIQLGVPPTGGPSGAVGLGCELLATTLPEMDSPPYNAVIQTHDYAINMFSSNEFTQSILGLWETAPFLQAADDVQAGGPRSTFFPNPPTYYVSDQNKTEY